MWAAVAAAAGDGTGRDAARGAAGNGMDVRLAGGPQRGRLRLLWLVPARRHARIAAA